MTACCSFRGLLYTSKAEKALIVVNMLSELARLLYFTLSGLTKTFVISQYDFRRHDGRSE